MVTNDSPLIEDSRSNRSAYRASVARTHAISDAPLCPSLNRIFSAARAEAGITLVAPLPDVDTGDLQCRRLEPVRAGVHRRRGQCIQSLDQPMDRIVGAMRIGDVALRAMHLDLHVDAAAAANFDHVAQLHRAGRLSDQTEIGDLVVRPHPIQHLDGAIDGRALPHRR